MTDDTEFVSVRLPADVANWLREYATANNLIRAGKPNMGGSIISAIRERMNGIETMSNNVGQIDIQAIVNTAIASQLADIQVAIKDEYGASFRGITGNFNDALQQRDREIDEINARIEALSSEATVSAKKPLLQIAREKTLAA